MPRSGRTVLDPRPREWGFSFLEPAMAETTDPLTRLTELEDKRHGLAKTLKDIDAQLGQTRRLTSDGTREMTRAEYSQWRNKAVSARRHVERELMDINHELKKLRQHRNERVIAANGIDVRDPDTLIAHAWALLHRLGSEGVDFDPQEQATVDGLRHYLAHVPAKGGG